MEDTGLTIKDIAALTGLSAHTLRYYERVGLVDRIQRAQSGHRSYSNQDIAWIEFLGRLRATGMSIRKMKQFADLRREGEATANARRVLLEEHRSEVRRRVADLERDLKTIDEKIDFYKGMEPKNDAAGEAGEPDALQERFG